MTAPLCKDCRHSIQDGAAAWWTCRRGPKQSPVDGRTIYASCDMMRADSRCGPEGKLFEPHPLPPFEVSVDAEPPDQYNRSPDQESQL